MRRSSGLFALSLGAVMLFGCGKGSGPSEDELVGTWHATKIEYVSTSGLGSIDLMTLGASITLELGADHTGVLTFTRVGGHVDVISGTWDSSIDVFSFGVGTGNWSWDMSMTGAELHLEGADTSWDFDGNGTQDDAKWDLVLMK